MESSAELQNPFQNRTWRVIPFRRYSGALNMAIDSYLAQSIKEGADPILRFYAWQPFCLSLGYHQNSAQLNLQKLYADGFEAVRRPTGGSAIFHAAELTYSLVIPRPFADHRLIYADFHSLLANALNKMGYGVELHKRTESISYLNKGAETFACFNRSAYTEITYNKRKVVGSAQKVLPGALLQHGSLMLGDDHYRITDYLSAPEETIFKYRKLLKQSSCCLNEISKKNVTYVDISEKIINEVAINGNNSIYSQQVTAKELKYALLLSPNFQISKNN